MVDVPITLRGCLTRDGGFEASIDRGKILDAIRAEIPGLPDGTLKLANVDLTRSLAAVLEIPLGDILKGAVAEVWNRWGARDKPTPGGAPREADLMDFNIESTHHPRIAVLVGPKQVFEVDLEIVVGLEVTGATIFLRAGKIERMRTGKSAGHASISLMNVNATMALGTPDFTLPGEIVFHAPPDETSQKAPTS